MIQYFMLCLFVIVSLNLYWLIAVKTKLLSLRFCYKMRPTMTVTTTKSSVSIGKTIDIPYSSRNISFNDRAGEEIDEEIAIKPIWRLLSNQCPSRDAWNTRNWQAKIRMMGSLWIWYIQNIYHLMLPHWKLLLIRKKIIYQHYQAFHANIIMCNLKIDHIVSKKSKFGHHIFIK